MPAARQNNLIYLPGDSVSLSATQPPTILIGYNDTYEVLICHTHHYAVSNLATHLAKEHKELSLENRKLIVDNFTECSLPPPKDVHVPRTSPAPIPGLAPPIEAYQCISHGCLVASHNQEFMRTHGKQFHRFTPDEQHRKPWKHVMAQTFFISKSQLKWFAVDAPRPTNAASTHRQTSEPLPANLTEQQLIIAQREIANWTRLRRQQVNAADTVTGEVNKEDYSVWIRKMGWKDRFADCVMPQVHACIALPADNEEQLLRAVAILKIIIADSITILAQLPQDHKRWLKSAKSTQPDSKPFEKLLTSSSMDRYSAYFCKFICFVLRLHIGQQLAIRYQINTSTDATDNQSIQQSGQRLKAGPNDDNNDNDDEDGDEDEDDEPFNYMSTPTVRRSASPVPPDHMRIISATEQARRNFPWTDTQTERVSELLRCLGNGEPDNDIKNLMIRVIDSFIFHHTGMAERRSGLHHFIGVLGWSTKNHRWERAEDFSPALAGMVYMIRLLSIHKLFPALYRDNPSITTSTAADKLFRETREDYLVDGCSAPMSIILSQLAYAKSITMSSVNPATVSWNPNKTAINFKGHIVNMHDFQAMAQRMVLELETRLSKDLFLISGSQRLPPLDLDHVHDSMFAAPVGHSFLTDPRNTFRDGAEGIKWMMNHIITNRSTEAPYGALYGINGWNRDPVKRYLKKHTEFLELLLICTHILSGQPARGPEITSLKFRNGSDQERNIFILWGQVFFITRYHKGMTISGKTKLVARFMPWKLGQAFVRYLAYIHPFQTCIQHRLNRDTGNSDDVLHDYVWSKDGEPWNTDRLTRIIQRHTTLSFGQGFGTLDYRHLVVSIGRQKVSRKFDEEFRAEQGHASEESDDEEEEDAIDLQNARTSKIGLQRYGVRADMLEQLNDRAFDVFRNLSAGWHEFLGLDTWKPAPASTTAPTPGHAVVHLPASTAASTSGHAVVHRGHRRQLTTTSVEVTPQNHPSIRTETSNHRAYGNRGSAVFHHNPYSLSATEIPTKVESVMKELFSTETVAYRSEGQKEGIANSLSGEDCTIVVLPTGGGKTLLMMVAAKAQPEAIFIVVAPFRALIHNLIGRFTAANIPCFEWTSKDDDRRNASIVVVSADRVGNLKFRQYAQGLGPRLRRIFYDECHAVIHDSHWRSSLLATKDVRHISAPLTLLTATLPPLMQSQLEQVMALGNPCPRYIREPTSRKQIMYTVRHAPQPRLYDEAIKFCIDCRDRLGPAPAKAIIYAKSRDMCTKLSSDLGCPQYQSGESMTDDTREASLQQWLTHGGLIVATSALGTGVDIPNIHAVIHVDSPYGMIDFAQQSGRAGRAGEPVPSYILCDKAWAEKRLNDPSTHLSIDEQAMLNMVTTTGCRRLEISEFLDGREHRIDCTSLAGAARCDNCGQGPTQMQAAGMRHERRKQRLFDVLNDLVGEKCVVCRFLKDSPPVNPPFRPHKTDSCPRLGDLTQYNQSLARFRDNLKYSGTPRDCFKCKIHPKWCGRDESSSTTCQWPHVMPALLVYAYQSSEKYSEMFSKKLELDRHQTSFPMYIRWLARKHSAMLMQDQWLTNAMAVFIHMVDEEMGPV